MEGRELVKDAKRVTQEALARMPWQQRLRWHLLLSKQQKADVTARVFQAYLRAGRTP